MFDIDFVIDEAGFQFSKLGPSDIEDALTNFCLLLDAVEQPVAKWSAIWQIPSVGDQILADLLFSEGYIDRDLGLLVGASLDRLPDWDETAEVAPLMNLSCDGVDLSMAPSLALCGLVRANGGRLGALSTPASQRSGIVWLRLPEEADPVDVDVISAVADISVYWRRVACDDKFTESQVASLAKSMFPNCVFAAGFFGQFDRLVGSYLNLLPDVLRHLAALSDHAPEVWRIRSQNHERIVEMASRAKVECSPEGPRTHRNVAAMNRRRFEFAGEHVLCEWHTKLEPHRNRIHFAVEGERVYIGCMIEHFPT
ncbi:hypothetical protein [Cellulomonas sp.]|uniref:hypothetical protein n=1 Tax=Cellulomonas sp. TaxID=40001 RepID=UPI001B0D7767|nr:hypothetical protein [Cellulomonas sp.]MBO9555541.1 hypothetical protein [Cellulomonas sp.]